MTNVNWTENSEYLKNRKQLTQKLRTLIVESLNLDIEPEVIQDDQPLFGRGLELDSIDALELSMNVSKEFDIEVSDDDMTVWSSVNKLADYILEIQHNANN